MVLLSRLNQYNVKNLLVTEEVSVEINIIYRYEYYKSTTQRGYTSSRFLECVADGVRQKHGLIRYLANSS